VSCEPRPSAALVAAQRFAKRRGGAVLATGSVYLVGDLVAGARARARSKAPAVPERSARA
jgi:hypothetical protein